MIKTDTYEVIDKLASTGRDIPIWATKECEYHCCDNDLITCELDVYDIDGCDYCTECAFNSIYTPERAIEYINSERDVKVDFYINQYMNCNIGYVQYDKISDEMLKLVINSFEIERSIVSNKINDLLINYCKYDKQDFIESFGYKRYSDE